MANITYADMNVRNVQEVISVSMFYSSHASGLAPIFANLTIVNITADSVKDVGSFECLDNSPCHGRPAVLHNLAKCTHDDGCCYDRY